MKNINFNSFLVGGVFAIPCVMVQAKASVLDSKTHEVNYQCASVPDSKPFSKIYFSERTQYRTAKRSFLERLMFSGLVLQDGWMKNMYWSVETDADLGEHFDQWKNSYQEIEVNKPIPFGHSDFYLEPGSVFHWEQAGSRIDPYIGLGYHFDPTLGAVLRYRYNHQNHDDLASDGSYDDSSEHRVDLYLTKAFTPDFQVQYNPTYYSKVHSDKFTYTNGKNHTLQHNFVFTWHAMKRIYPFAELGYMDKYKRGDSTENDYQIRLGVKFDIN